MTSTPESHTANFYGLGLAPHFLEILKRLKFHTPTPIQAKAIPLAIEGKDVVGIAQTGTGKTLAFGLPMMQRLAQKPGRGLVLVPTRELALQVHQSLRNFDHHNKMAVLIGGASMYRQIQDLRRKPRIIIATPGRLIDHMQQKNIQLHDIQILVLDEADRMLDMGFSEQIQTILRNLPKEKQVMLFSATMPQTIMSIASQHMKLPIHVEIAKPGTAAEKVSQEIFIVKREMKGKMLEKILTQYHGSTLVFSRTKMGARKITRALREKGHNAAEIHSDRTLGQRRDALEGFKSGKYRILVATDIAARGIDVQGIELVVNYDLPDDTESYVHRIGRTGRAGSPGHAISLASPEQGKEVQAIERLMRLTIPISEHPEFPKERFIESAPRLVASFQKGRFRSRRSFIASDFRKHRPHR